ncbi:MAG: PHP domain-containing protein [Candidatus Zixiibacteriota bacterium]
MCQQIDLHLHTNCSDGSTAPEELLAMVRTMKLKAFSVTDHDTLQGYWKVRELLVPGDPELVSGLELSVTIDSSDVHLLAYLFDPSYAPLVNALNEFRQRRNQRGRLIVQKLNEMGIDISYQDVRATAGQAAIGRPHIAETMFRLKAVRTYEEAFEKYIRNGGPAYVPKKNFTPQEAVLAVHKAGGVAVLAHPILDDAYRYIEQLLPLGLDGIELYHPFHKQNDIDRLKQMAQQHRLLVSGGSDYHGREDRWYGTLGSQSVPVQCLDKLKERAGETRGKH